MVSHFADSHSENFPDDSGGPQYAARRQTDRRHEQQSTVGLNFSHRPLAWLNYDLKSSFYNSVDDVNSPGIAPGARDPFGIPPNRSKGSFQRGTFTGSTTLAVLDHLSVNLGFEELIEHGANASELDFRFFTLGGKFKLTRYTSSPFFEARASWPFGLTLLGGVRADFPDKFSANVSPRVGAAYRVAASETTFKANWGEGFHLPSFFALGNPIVGNPNLKPETSKSFDIGASQSLWNKHVEVGVTYFDNRYRNLIDFDAGPPPQLVNRSNVTARGVEVDQIAVSIVKIADADFDMFIPQTLAGANVKALAGFRFEIGIANDGIAEGEKTRQMKTFAPVCFEGGFAGGDSVSGADARANGDGKFIGEIRSHTA